MTELQIRDQVEDGQLEWATRESPYPVQLVDKDGNPLSSATTAGARLAADNLALPTAPDVLATLMGYDGATLDLLRTGRTDTNGSSAGILNVIPMVKRGDNSTVDILQDFAGASDAGVGTSTLDVGQRLYNGSTWDRTRNNTEGTILASAARTATTNSTDQVNYNGAAGYLYFNVSAVPGGDTVTLSITGKDPISGSYVTLFTGAALATTGLRTYAIIPSGPTAADGVTGVCIWLLPRTWRVTITHSAGTSFTYSVGYALSS